MSSAVMTCQRVEGQAWCRVRLQGDSAASGEDLRTESECHGKPLKGCWWNGGLICPAGCRVDWVRAGAGGGETEPQRCSVTAIHIASKWQRWGPADLEPGRQSHPCKCGRGCPLPAQGLLKAGFPGAVKGTSQLLTMECAEIPQSRFQSRHTALCGEDKEGMMKFPASMFSLLMGWRWKELALLFLKCN